MLFRSCSTRRSPLTTGEFTIEDVVVGITDKIVRRHPHMFGEVEAVSTPAMSRQLGPDQGAEKARRARDSRRGAPPLPALMLAQKISRKAVSVGFEWESLDDVWEKVHEEIEELKATEPGSAEAADEIGDLLFTIVNLARKQGIDAETALRTTCEKFRARWGSMEQAAAEVDRDLWR